MESICFNGGKCDIGLDISLNINNIFDICGLQAHIEKEPKGLF